MAVFPNRSSATTALYCLCGLGLAVGVGLGLAVAGVAVGAQITVNLPTFTLMTSGIDEALLAWYATTRLTEGLTAPPVTTVPQTGSDTLSPDTRTVTDCGTINVHAAPPPLPPLTVENE